MASMTHEEQRIYLIQELLAEDSRFQNIEIPSGENEQKDLLRSLMNIRPPKPISVNFLAVQDEYLIFEREHTGIVDAETLPAVSINNRISLWKGDITTLKADAIVNAANSALLGCFHPLHSCIDNLIHSKSGIQLRLLCNEIMQEQGHDEPTGCAKITPGFNLPCKYILHTVGPIIDGDITEKDCIDLASCYKTCLDLASESGCKSIAFCCISTGVFHFPNQKAAEIAVSTVVNRLKNNSAVQKVIFNVFKEKDYAIYNKLLNAD
jgi:O-acetyl-ADP-ribose deacetylase (regulator of RNase III)